MDLSTDDGTRNQIMQTCFSSLKEEEISLSNEIYQLAENLGSVLKQINSGADDCAWSKSINDLDFRIEETLSKAIQKEIAAIRRMETGIAEYADYKPEGPQKGFD